MISIISSHNYQILTPKNKQAECNCKVKNSCPLHAKCLTSQLVYQADITNSLDVQFKYYLGLAEITFKERYGNQEKSFKMKLVKIVRNCQNAFGHYEKMARYHQLNGR